VHTVEDLFVDSQGEKTVIEVLADDEIGYEIKAFRDSKKIKLIIPGVAVKEKLLQQDRLLIRDGIINNVEIQKTKGSKNYDLEITVNLDNFASFELVTVPPSSVARLVIYKSAVKNKLIVIDPGHGGSEPGAVSGDILEKELNLDIGLRLKKILEGRDAKVFMTREDDIYVSKYARADMANEINADVFVSIHNNASTSPSGCGTETLYYPDPEKEALARAIQKSMVNTLGLRDRGIVSRTGLVVTRETKMPSALVEVAFMTNKDELSLLTTEDFRQKAAEAIAEGILNYLSGMAD
jgi:N-acetylmuramoyl-L-alanine amidase